MWQSCTSELNKQDNRVWNFTDIILCVIGLDWCWHSNFFLLCHWTGCPDCTGQLQPLPQQLLPVSFWICFVQWPQKQPLGFNTLYCMSEQTENFLTLIFQMWGHFPTLIKIEANRFPGRISSVLSPWICNKLYCTFGQSYPHAIFEML